MATETARPVPVVLAPGIETRADVQGGEPRLEGTRITTDVLYHWWRAGTAWPDTEARYPDVGYAAWTAAVCFEAGRRYEREQQRQDKRRRWVGTINDGQAWRDRGVAEACAYLRAAGQADLAAGLEAALGKEEGQR